MPLDNEKLWTVTPNSERLQDIRSGIDDSLDYSLDYERTLDEAYTLSVANVVHKVDQSCAIVVGELSPGSASPEGVIAHAKRRGLTPGAAVVEQLLVTVSGSGTVREGARVLDDVGQAWALEAAYTLDGGSLKAVEFTDGERSVVGTDALLLTSEKSGALEVGSRTYNFASSVSGVSISYDSLIRVGKDEESTSELRARSGRAGASPGGSNSGLISAILEIPGVTSAAVENGTGSVAVSVVYSGVLVDTYLLGYTIDRNKAGGAQTTGEESVTVKNVSGKDVEVYYSLLTTQSVSVVVELESSGEIADSELLAAAESAISVAFSRLSENQGITLLSIQGELSKVRGIVDLPTLTIDGGTSRVDPSVSTLTLVPVITSSVAT